MATASPPHRITRQHLRSIHSGHGAGHRLIDLDDSDERSSTDLDSGGESTHDSDDECIDSPFDSSAGEHDYEEYHTPSEGSSEHWDDGTSDDEVTSMSNEIAMTASSDSTSPDDVNAALGSLALDETHRNVTTNSACSIDTGPTVETNLSRCPWNVKRKARADHEDGAGEKSARHAGERPSRSGMLGGVPAAR